MRKLLTLILISSTINTFAGTEEGQLSSQSNSKQYCTYTNGKVVRMRAKFHTSTGEVDGVEKEFCQYDSEGNLTVIGLDTLSDQPTLAATYAMKLHINPNQSLPTSPYINPSLNVCNDLHGSEISFAVPEGGYSTNVMDKETDMCFFGDGSSISAWSLIYIADGNSPLIKRMILSEPMNIEIPKIK